VIATVMMQVYWAAVALTGIGVLAVVAGLIMVLPPALAARKRLQRVTATSKPLTGASKQLVANLESLQTSLDRISALADRGKAAFDALRKNLELLRDPVKLITGAD
jgi:hypothetical protein